VNAKDNQAQTLIHWAVKFGHLEVVRRLISAGADVNAKSNSGWTPIHEAAENGHLEVLKTLISAGADVNAKVIQAGHPFTRLFGTIDGKL